MTRLCVLTVTLLLLAGCGESTPAADATPADGIKGGPPGNPDWTPENPFGKKDFAAIEAELRCVEAALTGPDRAKAEAAVHAKWERTGEWVESVRAQVKAEPEFEDKFRETLDSHKATLCPDGKLSPEFAALLGLGGAATPAPASGAAPK